MSADWPTFTWSNQGSPEPSMRLQTQTQYRAPNSANSFTARSSLLAAILPTLQQQPSDREVPTSWALAACSLPTPTCPAGSGTELSSLSSAKKGSMPAALQATPTTPNSSPPTENPTRDESRREPESAYPL